MTQRASAQEVAAAETYERLFVPAEFQEWAPRVAAAAGVRAGERVLDVACGTGVLAREVARLVGPSGSVVGLDTGAGMLAVASRLSPSIEWQQGTAEALPFESDSFDAVVSQFGLMFFPDRVSALREMIRVVRPGGRLAVAVWDSLERTPAYADLVALIDRVAGRSAGDALRDPFALGDVEALGTLFADAGIHGAAIKTHHGTGQFDNIRTMVEAELRGWFPIAGILLPEDQITRILEDADQVLGRYRTPDGHVAFDSPAHIVSASKDTEAR
jgi:SAM-dependent methyltransferase